MRRVVVSEFLTLDGVMEDPGGAENFARGGWALKFPRGPEGDQFKFDELMASDALLLGRKTYEGFAAAWPSRTGEFADKMNGMAKYVVSTTLGQANWSHTTIINGHVAEEVAKLKAAPGQDILVAGSGQLVHSLRQADLVDEYRLMVFPVLLGKGKQLFQDGGSDQRPLRLMQARPVGSGVLILVYHPEVEK